MARAEASRIGDVSIPERVWGGLEPQQSFVVASAAVVSIPERVWGGLEQALNLAVVCPENVSIPERVWGGLELDRGQWEGPQLVFQSLRGFGVGWSDSLGAVNGSPDSVSIPERVWGGLEPQILIDCGGWPYRFNP